MRKEHFSLNPYSNGIALELNLKYYLWKKQESLNPYSNGIALEQIRV